MMNTSCAALVSIASDGLAILTLALAHIPLIQKLASVSSFWVFTISVSVVTLHLIIRYLIPPPPQFRLSRQLVDFIFNPEDTLSFVLHFPNLTSSVPAGICHAAVNTFSIDRSSSYVLRLLSFTRYKSLKTR
jgi:hypothetical protein